ncbi:MAG TPA: hypothetical protein VFX79_02595 [Candidatus Saccharimonadales bacterium]|nr:hypothetical protein [Candidatus Saccharimonadales bacterium]
MGIKAIIIAVVALAVVGGGAYYVTSKEDNKQQSAGSESSAQGEPNSIKGLLAQNKNVTCTFNSTDDSGNQTSGTVYIASERMRGDFTFKASGEAEQQSNVLRDSEYQYFWQEGADTGFKSKITEAEDVEGQDSENTQEQSVDQDAEYDFDCSDWSVDESMFDAPDGVEFIDYSAQIEQSKQLQQNATDQQKKACASITNESARQACENAVN